MPLENIYLKKILLKMTYKINKIKGIIIIVADALRMDSLIKLLNLNVVPTFRTLFKNGIVFENAFSLTNATDSSVTTIMTGLHPFSHGIINHGEKVSLKEQRRARKIISLPLILQNKKWFTVAIDILGRWHRRGFLKYENFASPYFKLIINQLLLSNYRKHYFRIYYNQFLKFLQFKKPIIYYNAPDYITKRIINNIKYSISHNKNFFIFAHYWSTHIPYFSDESLIKKIDRFRNIIIKNHIKNDLPVDDMLYNISHTKLRNYFKMWFNLLKYNNVSDVILSYYASILALDAELEKLLKFLQKSDILDKILIIFTADHGESLGEHNIYFDHHGLYNCSLHVPLIFYFDEHFLSEKIKNRVTLADIAPTLLSLLDIKFDHLRMDGYNLFIKDSKQTIVAFETYTEKKIAILYNNYKYITSIDKTNAVCRYCGRVHGDLEELYDIIEDPLEERNLIHERKLVYKYLKQKITKHILRFKLYLMKYKY